jgi:hypothetical protein
MRSRERWTAWAVLALGVLTAAAFLVILRSGLVLGFINSLHFWSVQLFFVFMVVHLWGEFWTAAWAAVEPWLR